MPATLNEIERKILDFMVQYLRDNTYQPSIREIGERFGIKSTKTVSEHLKALAQKGFLERDPSRSRGVRILGVDLNADTVSIPCYQDVPAGRGTVRNDGAEAFLTLDRRLAGAKGSFFLSARGEELAVLGVEDGDLLLIEPVSHDELSDGAIVLARAGGGAAYRRVGRNGQGVSLGPLTPSAPPADPAAPADDPQAIDLVGRVVALYRRMDGAPTRVSLTTH